MQRKLSNIIILSISLLLFQCNAPLKPNSQFNGHLALQMVERQVAMGPRTPGSDPHDQAIEFYLSELTKNGWSTETQQANMMGHTLVNVIGKWGQGYPLVILGAHYDTRILSDRDPIPAFRSTPTPGANDGASGVAVLLELSRVIPYQIGTQSGEKIATGDKQVKQIWLVLFDAEDNGNIEGWDWILGSRAFVNNLSEEPSVAIVLDMVGDANLKIYQEGNSDPEITDEIWITAAKLGYSDRFIPTVKYSILDDHIPFMEAGIPAVDIIDFEYPYRHTTQDTPDKVSSDSLQVVGDTILTWLKNTTFSE